MVSQIPKDLKSICRVCFLALLFYFCFKGIVRDRFTLFSSSISWLSCALYFLICCSIFKDRCRKPGLYLRAADFYSTTLSGICQEVFWTFFKKLFLQAFRFPISRFASFGHLIIISQPHPFVKPFFQVFSKNFFAAHSSGYPPQSAPLLYHFFSGLSREFWHFLHFIPSCYFFPT